MHRIKSTPSCIDTVKMNKIALKDYDNKKTTVIQWHNKISLWKKHF